MDLNKIGSRQVATSSFDYASKMMSQRYKGLASNYASAQKQREEEEDALRKLGLLTSGDQTVAVNPDGSVKYDKNYYDLSDEDKKAIEAYNSPVSKSAYKKSREIFDNVLNNKDDPEYERAKKLNAYILRDPEQMEGSRTKGFLEYLNPVGDYGLFGKHNLNTVANVGEDIQKWGEGVNEDIFGENQEGFDAGDPARFVGNLLPGMVSGFLQSGRNAREAVTGKRLTLDEDRRLTGEEEDLSGTQRLAAGAVSILDTAGLAVGGSGKLVKEIFRKPLDAALKGTIKETTKDKIVGTAVRMNTEGIEEALSSIAEDIQDDDQLSEDWLINAAKSYGLGVAAGGVFDVTGSAIRGTKTAIKTKQQNVKTGTTADVRAEMSEKVKAITENENLTQSEKTKAVNALTKEAQATKDVTDFTTKADEVISNANQDSAKVQSEKLALELEQINIKAEENIKARDEAAKTADMRSVRRDLRKLARNEQKLSDARVNELQGELNALIEEQNSKQAELDAINTTISYFDLDDANGSYFAREVDNSAETDAEVEARINEEIKRIDNSIADINEYYDVESGVDHPAVQRLMAQKAELETKKQVQMKAVNLRDLQKRRADIMDWQVQNNISENIESLTERLDDLRRGVVPDELVTPYSPAKTSSEAVSRIKDVDTRDVTGIQRAYAINEAHRKIANDKLSQLWTQERHTKYMEDLNKKYKAEEEEARQLPGPAMAEATQLMDQEYVRSMEYTRKRLQEDANEVSEVEQAIQVLDDIDQNIVDQYNNVLASDPKAFGRVDPNIVANVEGSLEAARGILKIEEDPASITPLESQETVQSAVRNAETTKQATEIIDGNEALSEASINILKDQVRNGNLNVNFRDNFVFTTRQGLLKLENGDKIVEKLDWAIHESAKSDARMKVVSIRDKWKNAYRNEATSEATIAYLDQGQPLTRLDNESETAFNKRVKASESIARWLDDKWVEAETARGNEVTTRPESEMYDNNGRYIRAEKEGGILDYFPHAFEQAYGADVKTVGEALARLDAGINEKGNKLTVKQREMLQRKVDGVPLATQEAILANRIWKVQKNGHLETRHGAEGWSKDVAFVLQQYHTLSNSSNYMQPAITEIKNMTSDLENQQLRFVQKAVASVTGRDAGANDILGKKVSKVLQTTRRFSNMALMGASLRTIALQPVATINNWRDAPNSMAYIKSTIKSMVALDPRNIQGNLNPLLQEYLEAGGAEGSWHANLTATKMTKLETALLSGIGKMDQVNRLAAYDMGKQEYIKSLGKKPDQLTPVDLERAKEAGVAQAKESQFALGPLDVPMAQNSEVGKLIFQLQQFNMKQAGKEIGYLYGDKDTSLIKVERDADGNVTSRHLTKKGAETVVKTAIGYYLITMLYTEAMMGDDEDSKNPFGFDWYSLLPFGEQIAGVWEFATTGQIEDTSAMQITPPVISGLFGRGNANRRGVIGHLGSAIVGGEDVDRGVELESAIKEAIRGFVPAGTQGFRTFEGAKAVEQGESMNSSGSTRFLIDNQSGWNVVKGLIGGQYATTEGQAWLEKGMNTIPRSYTIEDPRTGEVVPISEFARSDGVSPETQAQLIGYYSQKVLADGELSKHGLSKSTTVDKLKLQLKAGVITQSEALRQVDEWNNRTAQLYAEYFDGNNNVPAYITNDFLKKVLIDTSTLRNS